MAEPARKQQDPDRLREAQKAIVGRLETEADARVNKRRQVEIRWVNDLRQFRGEYDSKTMKDLKAAGKSQLFINQTLSKTNACEARLSDMLFPTEDKNWGIQPTPVPELTKAAKTATDKTKALVSEANTANAAGDTGHADIAAEAQGEADKASSIKAEMDQAKDASEGMSAEIDDQLKECLYNIQARDVIGDACKIGTGVMKGPVAKADRSRRSWRKVKTDDGEIYQLDFVEDPRPAYYRVDPWGWFPESDARTLEESESFFERHLYTNKKLKGLAKQPGFDQDAIRRLLRAEPNKNIPVYLTELRSITGENVAPSDGRYIVWEYRGPLTAEDMQNLCSCMGRDDLLENYEDMDPLEEVGALVWFCQGEVLKFGIHHLDSGEPIYSVYNLEKDDSSIWGYGIPYLMSDSQSALNGAWRMMMDNSGLSSGPQIVVDDSAVEPEDGIWELVSRKIWRKTKPTQKGYKAFEVHEISSHQAELEGVINLAKQFIDDETSISVLAQGEQGTHTTQTAQGMALLMNAVNVVFRRFVKNFDDDMTVPNIRRLYDWNMQFSPKEHIKGDFEVDARGSSVLLVKELQAQNLMVLSNFTGHPVLGMLLKGADIVRKLAQSMMIPADEVVKTDDELKQEFEAESNKPIELSPEIQLKLDIAKINAQSNMDTALMNRETEMMKLAQQHNMTLDQLRTKLDIEQIKSDSKERIIATEVAVEQSLREQGETGGSGGFISQ